MSDELTIVRDTAALQQVMPEWRGFVAQQPGSHDFFSDPAMVEYELAHGDLTPFIVLIRREGVLQCIAPFRIQPSRFQLQLSVFQLASPRARFITLFGSDFTWGADADMVKCCALVFEAVQQATFDLIFLNAIDMQSALWRYCVASENKPNGLCFVRPSRVTDNLYCLEMADSFEEYAATLGSSTRGSIKRRIKKLTADHSATLVTITSADQVPKFLDDVETIYRESWQSRTYGHARRNSESEIARLQHIAGLGWLRCYLLTSDSGPMAFQFGYGYGDVFYACDFAFAREWSSYGPGAALMYLMLEDLYKDKRFRRIDLRAGNSPQKQTFRAVAHQAADVYVAHRNRWRVLLALQRGFTELEGAVRGALVGIGLDNTVRRVLKRKRWA